MIDAYRILVRKSEERRHLGGVGMDESIKMGLADTEPDGVGWIEMAQARVSSGSLVSTIENFGFQAGYIRPHPAVT
jgi:hypothetical protein